jgi:NADH-quinone oxidoreductase subunit N
MVLTSNAIDLVEDSVARDVQAFLPELILCGGIVLLLLLRLFRAMDRWHLGGLALLLSLAALVVSCGQWRGMFGLLTPESFDKASKQTDLFSGLLVYDNFTVFLRLFLFGFSALLIWLTMLTGIPDREDSADFYSLVLGATVGMSLMASANHLLMVYIGVEMASLPSYALAGFLKGRRQSSEASLKYVVYGGGASGIMLYGISLLAGKFGTAYLPDLAAGYMTVFKQPAVSGLMGYDTFLLLGTLFVFIGLSFKLAAVPFHFWCPDVFEGASAEVAAFLSVASKGAALALTGRLALMLAGLSDLTFKDPTGKELFGNWLEVARFLVPALAILAGITATFGNLAAYPQTNLKRLLAYSTIAHAGYMLMGLATLTQEGAGAVLFYLIAYLFMNLGAFAIVAFLRNQTGSEDLSDFRGLVNRSPVMVVLLAIFLLSLLGLPPLAGFAAKFQIFSALFDAGQNYSAADKPSLGYTMYALLVVGGLNTAISAVYYLKVLKVMILDRTPEEIEGQAIRPLPTPVGSGLYGALLAIMIFVVGTAWNPLAQASDHGVNRFQRVPRQVRKTTRPPAKTVTPAEEVRR